MKWLANDEQQHSLLVRDWSESKGGSFQEEFVFLDGYQVHILLHVCRTPTSYLLHYLQYRSIFSNAIAFEMLPETDTNMGVTAYFNFMKTLINNAEDVKVLREKGILCSMLANDKEVVEMFKSIDIYGLPNNCFFTDVNMGIAEHCTSKARTWMVQLINTNFRISWTVLAITFLLCLTFIQTD